MTPTGGRDVDTFDLRSTYLHIADGPPVTPVAVGHDFWSDIPAIFDDGRMVGIFGATDDWPTWERHPDGDEVVVLLSGAATFVLEEPGGERHIRVRAGDCVVVPRNVWHRALVHEPYEAVHITRGAGTENRAHEP